MKLVVFCLRLTSFLALLSPGLAFNQTSTQERAKAAEAAGPVAHVYVSQSPVNPGPNQVLGFSAAENGRLKPIPGSPFEADVNFMVVNRKYLFGSTTDDLYLDTYAIEPDGALTFAVANDISKMTRGKDTIGQTLALSLDHTGATLYAFRFPDYADNDEYESYTIDKATGALTLTPGYTPNGGNSDNGDGAFAISANDKYFYGVASGEYGYDVWMMDRKSNGTLVQPPGSPVIARPEPKNGYRFDPIGIAADPSNHVAVVFMNMKWYGTGGTEDGPSQIAVYTADAKGNLTTTSTYKTMPKVAVDTMPTDALDFVGLKMAPSGKVLAAFGGKGLQIFHFNGASPVTPYATLVQNVDFEQAYWDNSNHLFAVSQKTGKLYVFTVTPTSITHAPGSPYSIPGAQDIMVQPLL